MVMSSIKNDFAVIDPKKPEFWQAPCDQARSGLILSEAITNSEAELFLAYLENPQWPLARLEEIVFRHKTLTRQGITNPYRFYHSVITWSLDLSNEVKTIQRAIISTGWQSGLHLFKSAVGNYIREFLFNPGTKPRILNHWGKARALRLAFSMLKTPGINGVHIPALGTFHTLLRTPHLLAFSLPGGKRIAVMHIDCLINITLCCSCWWLGELYAYLRDYVSHLNGTGGARPLESDAWALWMRYCQECMSTYSEDPSKLTKDAPMYFVAKLCKLNDPYWNSEILRLTDENIRNLAGSEEVKKRWEELVAWAGNDDQRLRLMIGVVSCVKAAGCPVTFPKGSGEQIRAEATRHMPLNPELEKIAFACFNQQFMYSFCERHRRYPRYAFWPSVTPSGTLLKIYLHNFARVEPISHIHILRFADILITEKLDWELPDHILETLSDTAVTGPLTNFSAHYYTTRRLLNDADISKWCWNYNGPRGDSPFDRRLCAAVLNDRNGTLGSIIRHTENHGFHPDDRVVVLRAKEGEQKRFPRLFAIQSYPVRIIQGLLEHAIGDYVLPHISLQTMHLSSFELEGVNNEWRSMSARTERYLFINLDFSVFNLHFHQFSFYRINMAIHNLLDVRDIGAYNQHAFAHSFVYVKTPGLPPVRHCSETQWSVFDCCMQNKSEGLDQKKMTAKIVCLLGGVLKLKGRSSKFLASGDNIVVRIPIPVAIRESSPAKKAAWVNENLSILKEASDGVGIPIKLEETLTTSKGYVYLKDIYIQGLRICNNYRFIAAACSTPAEVDDEIRDIFSISYSLGTDLAASSSEPLTAMCLSEIHALSNMWDFFPNEFMPDPMGFGPHLSPRSYISWRAIPYMFGGPPLPTPYAFFMRGESDTLVEGLRHMKYTYNLDANSGIPGSLDLLKWEPPTDETRLESLCRLVEDPYGLPIQITGRREKAVWSRTMVKELRDSVKNPTALQGENAPFSHDQEIQNLFRTKGSINIRLIINLVETLPTYIEHRRIKVIQKPNTLRRIAKGNLEQETKVHQLYEDLKRVMAINVEAMRESWYACLNYRGPRRLQVCGITIDPLGCSYEQAKEIRRILWGIDIEGLSTPSPIEAVTIVDDSGYEAYTSGTALLVTKSPYIEDIVMDAASVKESFKTEEKLKVISKTKERVRHILFPGLHELRIAAICELSGLRNYSLKARALCDAYYPGAATRVKFTLTGNPGHISHRLATSGIPVASHRLGKSDKIVQFFVSSNNLSGIVKGGQDFNINFGALFNFIKVALGVADELQILGPFRQGNAISAKLGIGHCFHELGPPCADLEEDLPDRPPLFPALTSTEILFHLMDSICLDYEPLFSSATWINVMGQENLKVRLPKPSLSDHCRSHPWQTLWCLKIRFYSQARRLMKMLRVFEEGGSSLVYQKNSLLSFYFQPVEETMQLTGLPEALYDWEDVVPSYVVHLPKTSVGRLLALVIVVGFGQGPPDSAVNPALHDWAKLDLRASLRDQGPFYVRQLAQQVLTKPKRKPVSLSPELLGAFLPTTSVPSALKLGYNHYWPIGAGSGFIRGFIAGSILRQAHEFHDCFIFCLGEGDGWTTAGLMTCFPHCTSSGYDMTDVGNQLKIPIGIQSARLGASYYRSELFGEPYVDEGIMLNSLSTLILSYAARDHKTAIIIFNDTEGVSQTKADKLFDRVKQSTPVVAYVAKDVARADLLLTSFTVPSSLYPKVFHIHIAPKPSHPRLRLRSPPHLEAYRDVQHYLCKKLPSMLEADWRFPLPELFGSLEALLYKTIIWHPYDIGRWRALMSAVWNSLVGPSLALRIIKEPVEDWVHLTRSLPEWIGIMTDPSINLILSSVFGFQLQPVTPSQVGPNPAIGPQIERVPRSLDAAWKHQVPWLVSTHYLIGDGPSREAWIQQSPIPVTRGRRVLIDIGTGGSCIVGALLRSLFPTDSLILTEITRIGYLRAMALGAARSANWKVIKWRATLHGSSTDRFMKRALSQATEIAAWFNPPFYHYENKQARDGDHPGLGASHEVFAHGGALPSIKKATRSLQRICHDTPIILNLYLPRSVNPETVDFERETGWLLLADSIDEEGGSLVSLGWNTQDISYEKSPVFPVYPTDPPRQYPWVTPASEAKVKTGDVLKLSELLRSQVKMLNRLRHSPTRPGGYPFSPPSGTWYKAAEEILNLPDRETLTCDITRIYKALPHQAQSSTLLTKLLRAGHRVPVSAPLSREHDEDGSTSSSDNEESLLDAPGKPAEGTPLNH